MLLNTSKYIGVNVVTIINCYNNFSVVLFFPVVNKRPNLHSLLTSGVTDTKPDHDYSFFFVVVVFFSN